MVVERVLTDNAFAYRGEKFNEALTETRILHRSCRPYRPQTNGKAPRFNRTLLEDTNRAFGTYGRQAADRER